MFSKIHSIVILGMKPCPLIIGEHHFNRRAVIKALNKNATLLNIRMGVEKRGDFCSVVFQGRAAADQLLFFRVVVIVVDLAAGVKVMVAFLQRRRLVQL